MKRLTKTFVLLTVGAVVCLPAAEERGVGTQSVWAQQGGGRNIFEKSTSSESSPPNADEAIRQRFSEISENFGSNFSVVYYIAFFVFLAAVVGILVYYDLMVRRKNGPDYDNPRVLFRELCATHRFTAAEKRFLKNLAEDLDLEDPLPLFIEPSYFVQALEDARFDASGQMLRYLLGKLFDIKVAAATQKHVPSTDQHSDTTVLVPSPLQKN